jgi:molybdopterin synthase catalytic subunit
MSDHADMSDLIAIRSTPITADEAVRFATDSTAGGIAVFLGTTRAETSPDGRALLALDYEAYADMAAKQLQDLATRVRGLYPVVKCAILHRTGRVAVGEASVVIAVSTPHRADAFAACKWLIDALKVEVAIWKKEVWADGSTSWVHPAG